MHNYKFDQYNIVIDSASGSIHLVDEDSYKVIEKLKEGQTVEEIEKEVKPSDLAEILKEIELLKSEGKMFSEEIEHKNIKRTVGEIKALCLHIAHTCNLTCEYCFASQGKYADDETLLMTPKVGKQAVDFLIANSASRHNLEVDFFGGEPLMNFQTVKEVVAYAREREKEENKKFRFTLTTNGILLDDDIITFANEEMDNVVLSLDGRKEIHDIFRKEPDGSGSYNKIVPKFQDFVEARQGKGYYIRGTYTKANMDFVKDIEEMLSLGFNELSLEPVVCKPEEPYGFKEEDLPILFKEYEKLTRLMMDKEKNQEPFSFYHYNIDFEAGPCIHKRVAGCGSGTEYLAVTPTGNLFPCHQFVSMPKFQVGTLDQGVTEIETVLEFAQNTIYSKEDCRDCWARLFCSGGCPANAYSATGNIKDVDTISCKLFKKRLECAIALNIFKLEI